IDVEQWKEIKQRQEHDKLQGKNILIGIDPGRKDIATCVREDLRDGSEKVTSLSNALFYNDAKVKQRQKKMRHHLREAGLTEWNRTMPSFKVFIVSEFEEAIR